MNFIISFTGSNGQHQKDVEQHDSGETCQQQEKTVTSPFNAEPTGTEQHQPTLYSKKIAEQVYVGMHTMPYMRELGGYLGQTSLLRKNFKIRGIIGNSGQKNRISFGSLTHQIYLLMRKQQVTMTMELQEEGRVEGGGMVEGNVT